MSKRNEPNEYGDFPLPEDEEIAAAFPMRSGRHDLYAEAARMVGAKHSKYALVDLVNMLLHRIEQKNELLEQEKDHALNLTNDLREFTGR